MNMAMNKTKNKAMNKTKNKVISKVQNQVMNMVSKSKQCSVKYLNKISQGIYFLELAQT
jgi:hypothetical protein